MGFLERRKETRLQGKLDVALESETTVTRDFSPSGVYFETDQRLSPGCQTEFSLDLEHPDLGVRTRIRCRGEVVRAESRGEKMGVAVAIESYCFERIRDAEPDQE